MAHVISSSLVGKPTPEGSEFKWRYSKPIMKYGDALPEKFDFPTSKDAKQMAKIDGDKRKGAKVQNYPPLLSTSNLTSYILLSFVFDLIWFKGVFGELDS